MDERQTDAPDNGPTECNHDTGCGNKSSTDEPTVYGPLAQEMLFVTVDYGDHESVRDCLATLADRLENLEVVVYGNSSNKSCSVRIVLRQLV